jgi:nitrate reductase delta subunit
MDIFTLLAEAFRYPAPGRLEELEKGWSSLPSGTAQEFVETFIRRIQGMPLGEWEELYTHTFDLSPSTAPYVGFQTWGESYQRGNFMALMNRELSACAIDLDGELPDHLVPVLRYLAVASPLIPELVEILEPAVQRMRLVLAKSGPGNPYLVLLEAVEKALREASVKI